MVGIEKIIKDIYILFSMCLPTQSTGSTKVGRGAGGAGLVCSIRRPGKYIKDHENI